MSHSEASIRKTISDYIQREYFADDPAALSGQTALLSEGVIDSISVMVLIEFLESSFHIEFEPHEVDPDNLDSIDLITAFVQSKLQ